MANIAKPLSALLATAMFAACSSSGVVPSPQAPAVALANGAHHGAKGRLVLRIHVSRKRKPVRATPRYISPATAAITIAITGPTDVNKTAALTPNATGCSSSLAGTFCTLTIPGLTVCQSGENCYKAVLATYDAVTGCPAACAIPTGAHELSGNQDVAFTIAVGKANAIAATLDGIPNSLAFIPLDSALSGNESSGFSLSKCFASAQVEVLGVDGSGNIILGAGAPVPTLSSSDTADIAIAAPSLSLPNTFKLSRLKIPSARTAVKFTASVMPLAGSGGGPVSQQINVTFDSSICGVITEFSAGITSGSSPYNIAAGPDGNMWFTEEAGNRIGRITPTGTVTEFSPSQFAVQLDQPYGIVAGPNGKLWFTEIGERIGELDPTTGAIVEFTSGISSSPTSIANGFDGNLWFTEDGEKIGRITTAGTITEFSNTATDGDLRGIATGPDGNLYYTSTSLGRIGVSNPFAAYSGSFYSLAPSAGPRGITAGPDDAMWAAETTGNRIARIGIDGSLEEFSTGLTASSGPKNIAAGADGNLWFTECEASRIGRITTNGAISEYSTGLTAGSISFGIAAGPDGSLWFTQPGGEIGRLQ